MKTLNALLGEKVSNRYVITKRNKLRRPSVSGKRSSNIFVGGETFQIILKLKFAIFEYFVCLFKDL